MLTPELDKLRDKELSFWCYVYAMSNNNDDWVMKNTFIVHKTENSLHKFWKNLLIIWWRWYREVYESNVEIIWHPLTRWRINQLEMDICMSEYKDYNDSVEWTEVMLDFWLSGEITPIVAKIEHILLYKWLWDKSEIERMKHEKRPELKELLIQFSNYL